MKFWKRGRFPYGLAAACLMTVFLAGSLAYSFEEYKSQIVKEQEEQLMTIAQAVSNSIDLYIRFYFDDLDELNSYGEYQEAGEHYLKTGDKALLEEFLRDHLRTQSEDVSTLLVSGGTEAGGRLMPEALAGDDRRYFSVHRLKGAGEGAQIDILEDEEKRFYLGLSAPTIGGKRLCFVINVEQMYSKVGSYIKVGENGYVMIKDSTGRILMHPVKEQIGVDVIEGREEMYPDFDFSELERLIARQEEGREGVETYHSYWWADEVPTKVKKIAAYTPMGFGDDFLIVSAVIDYDEIAQPVSRAMATIFLLTIAVMTVFAAILYRLRLVARARSRAEQENKYLRELNAKLEELRAGQEQLFHDQRLQLMGSLTGGIAHEFNNLLTPIMGYSGMIMMEAEPGSDIYEGAEEIYRSSERAKEIIRQIASMSRKHTQTGLRPVRVKKAVEGVLKILETVVPPNVSLIVQAEWDEESSIRCGETELNQILLNLSNNAFHAMRGKKGVLTIGGRIVKGDEAERRFRARGHFEAYMSLFVKDNGHGIPKENLERIFDPFYTTKQVGEGTGLGLATVSNLLEFLNGGIEVESREGEGSCFTIYIPLCSPDAPETERAARRRPKAPESGKSILLVEDDKKILKLFNRSLRAAGYQVTAIADPLKAEGLLTSRHFDVIVTDYAMPGMNGAQLAVLAGRLGFEGRIIMMTGLVEEQVLEYYRKNLIHELLVKPLEAGELVEAIEREK